MSAIAGTFLDTAVLDLDALRRMTAPGPVLFFAVSHR